MCNIVHQCVFTVGAANALQNRLLACIYRWYMCLACLFGMSTLINQPILPATSLKDGKPPHMTAQALTVSIYGLSTQGN